MHSKAFRQSYKYLPVQAHQHRIKQATKTVACFSISSKPELLLVTA